MSGPYNLGMKRSALWLPLGTGLLLAMLVGRKLSLFLAEDACLDAGGRVDAARGLCETAGGAFLPLSTWPPTFAAWLLLVPVALLPGALAFWLLRALFNRPSPAR